MSPTSAQRRGTYFEKKTAAALRRDGYEVIEARASKGLADLWAAKTGQLLMIQVKAGEADLADGWWNDLFGTATRVGALAIIADYPRAGRLRLRRIIRPHDFRSQRWPCVPFIVDEAALDHGAATRKG